MSEMNGPQRQSQWETARTAATTRQPPDLDVLLHLPSLRGYERACLHAIKQLGSMHRRQDMLQFLDSMSLRRVPPDKCHYSTAIAALAKMKQWQHAIALLS